MDNGLIKICLTCMRWQSRDMGGLVATDHVLELVIDAPLGIGN
jgi:hypothetical protein